MRKVAALLPIKQNSERVQGKNFRDLCGKPLYQWILETLLDCRRVSRVIVDTDDEAFIHALGRAYPAVQTILRPNDIRGGMVSMNRVIAHDLAVCKEESFFLQTHATNPLLTRESIDEAIDRFFKDEEHDSLFSVNRIQARTYRRDGTPVNHTLGDLRRTQDLEPIYEENSNLFIFSRETFLKTGSRLGERPLLFETARMESLEIDEEEDFAFVELVLKALLSNGRKEEG